MFSQSGFCPVAFHEKMVLLRYRINRSVKRQDTRLTSFFKMPFRLLTTVRDESI